MPSIHLANLRLRPHWCAAIIPLTAELLNRTNRPNYSTKLLSRITQPNYFTELLNQGHIGIVSGGRTTVLGFALRAFVHRLLRVQVGGSLLEL